MPESHVRQASVAKNCFSSEEFFFCNTSELSPILDVSRRWFTRCRASSEEAPPGQQRYPHLLRRHASSKETTREGPSTCAHDPRYFNLGLHLAMLKRLKAKYSGDWSKSSTPDQLVGVHLLNSLLLQFDLHNSRNHTMTKNRDSAGQKSPCYSHSGHSRLLQPVGILYGGRRPRTRWRGPSRKDVLHCRGRLVTCIHAFL